MKIKQVNHLLLFGLFTLSLASPTQAEYEKEPNGWEKGSRYNRFYNADETDSFKGEIVDILEVIPIKGMSPGLAISVKESEEEPILVHLCPVWYADAKKIGVKKGDRVKVRGAWAEIEGKSVFMASKVKKGDFLEVKIRLTKDGTPFWTMTPEELAKEKREE